MVLSRHPLGETEGNNDKLQLGWSVIRPRFKLGTFGTQIHSVTAAPTCFVTNYGARINLLRI